MDDKLSQYCLMAMKDDVTISHMVKLTTEQCEFFKQLPQIHFNIGNAMLITFHRNELDYFDISLVQ